MQIGCGIDLEYGLRVPIGHFTGAPEAQNVRDAKRHHGAC